MKITFSALLLVPSANAANLANIHSVDYYAGKFDLWQQQYQHHSSHALLSASANQGEWNYRLQVFSDNDDIIAKHNAGNSTFVLGHNQFSCMTKKEFTAKYLDNTYKAYKPGATGNAVLSSSELNNTLASTIDWVQKGAVTGVKNQGSCGSCWSFSTTGAMEGAYQIKTGTLKSFSEQQLVSCDDTNNGCNGGLMDNAFSWLEKNGGICTEADYGYSSAEGSVAKCDTSCSKVPGTTPTKFTDVEASDSAMMDALNNGPVSVAIEADTSVFQLYASGVLSNTKCGTQLDHGVLAVGYGTDDGTDYYKVKNSWGTTWGMGGYILLERGQNAGTNGMCGILSGPPSYPTL